jgi:hypothetical protein
MKIYDQHQAAFAKVASFCIIYKSEPVASIAIKYPRDGAGRLYVYVHWRGCHMVRGFASGGGYDKATAAIREAIDKIADCDNRAFIQALTPSGGAGWQSRLERAGFTVFQTI